MKHIKYSAMRTYGNNTTSMGRKGLFLIVASVRTAYYDDLQLLLWIAFVDKFYAEDPAEFFSMIFGGEAFMDL